jgi:protein TonB
VVRGVASAAIGVAGTFGVVALSLGMNAQVERVVTEPVATISTEVGTEPARPPENRKARSSPVRRSSRTAPSPGPLLAAGLSGLDFGLGSAADLALADATAALVGDLGGAVMDEGNVEDPPRPTRRDPPEFPARARSLGQSGKVTLSFVVDVDGSVQDVMVVESSPPGVFDDAAVDAVRGWSFSPGRHEGLPVAVRVRQTLTFELE